MLRAILCQRGTLDVAHVGDGNHLLVVGIEILGVELAGAHHNLGAALVAILLLDFHRLVLHNLELQSDIRKHIVEVLNLLEQLLQLSLELAALQTCQSPQTHIYHRLCLQLGEPEALHQVALGDVGVRCCTDDADNLVDIVLSNQQTLHDVGPRLGSCQVVLGAAHHNLVAVLHKGLHHILEAHEHRATTHQSNVVHRERTLQGGVLVEVLKHNTAHSVLLQYDNDADTLLITLVIDVGDTLNLLLIHELCNLLHQLCLIDHIGNLGHHDALPTALGILNLSLSTDYHTALTRLNGLPDTLVAIDNGTCGEVGTLHILTHLAGLHIGVVDVGTDGVAALREVVGSHVGGHTHSDTIRAVDHQQGDTSGEHGGLQLGIVEVVGEVHGILLDVGHHLVGDFPHAGLGVTHSCGRVAIHRAEVTLTIHQRVAQAPRLRHAAHSVVDGTIAVGVELTHHITHDTGALTGRLVGVKTQLVAHAIEDAAMNGFHTVPCIGQSSRNDYRH